MNMIGGELYFFNQNYKYIDNSLLNYLKNFEINLNLFSTGRDALYAIFNNIKDKKIWIPNFLCESVLNPIIKNNLNYEFYNIYDELKSDIEFKPKKNDYILIINFFGFVDKNLYRFSIDNELNIISDTTHLIFNKEKFRNVLSQSKYIIGSLRKSFALPDGAYVLSNANLFFQDKSREDFVYLRTYGLFSRYYSSINNFNNDENFNIIKNAESILDNSNDFGYKISYLSENILKCINLNEYILKIKQNFNILNKGLNKNYNFYSQYFPILFKSVEQRNIIRDKLFENKIFAPIHWNTDFLGDFKNNISDEIISIPCDYRYGLKDMEKILNIINNEEG
ncbi:hypothetical protein [Oceanotoga teriensis]|uniref:hypothetical protein n=1 Tax=Oceanotoga teriensis TaxID=515440 RepID=UPI002712CBE9|nr:hypothetical protein [Oceanotoga teriensis]MDO7975804.1 hypothetical protein [Oceanotoga teriensis]